jgi:uracil-DNA glycosylase
VADDKRAALAEITRKVHEHVRWLDRGGVVGVPLAPPRAVVTPAHRAVAVAPAAPSSGGAARLQLVRDELGECTRCKLSKERTNIVFGTGSPDAALVFVGEAPGAEEDRTGEPFVGAAGQLLTKMIEAMGFHRSDVYICNIIKSRPPGNRNPEPDEIAACEPFLKAQLAAIRPRMLVCLGKFAAQTLLRSDAPISRMRGRFQAYEGIPLMPTFHPAFLLRNPAAKREVWADLQMVMAELDRLGIPRPRANGG